MKQLHYHGGFTSLFRNRHWHVVKRHVTPRRLWNAAHVGLDFKLGRPVVGSRPLYAKIETTDCCNLRCPGCHDAATPRKHQFLDFGIYRRLIDEIGSDVLEISLFDQGEPLIDPRIFDYVDLAHERNIGTVISSNLSFRYSSEKIERLVHSGLDYLQVAIDGVTQETYEQYRHGGDLHLVMENLGNILEARNSAGRTTPMIEWQLIAFDFNGHEVEAAEKLAKEMGVDSFVVKPDGRCGHATGPYDRANSCPLLWSSFALECDGQVSACLVNDDDSLFVGNLNEESFAAVWNGRRMQELRASLCSREGKAANRCTRCDWFDMAERRCDG